MLPYFDKDDKSEEAQGFIKSAFSTGLKVTDMYLTGSVARIALNRKLVTTQDSGYLQRKLAKSLEDAIVWADGSVRDGTGNIIQYIYGEDGFSPTKCILVNLYCQKCTHEDRDEFTKFL